MPSCCRCNGSNGRCKNCSCVKNNIPCTNCLLVKKGSCLNHPAPVSDLTQQSDSSQQQDFSQHHPPKSSDPSSHQSEMESDTQPSDTPSSRNESYTLPPYPTSSILDLHWGSVHGEQLASAITLSYALIVHWKPNLFLVPSGHQGNRFVDELTRLFNSFTTNSSLQPVAIQAAMLLPALALQKPVGKIQTRELSHILQRRLDQWGQGDILGLLEEGKLIQRQLEVTRQKTKSDDRFARTFAKLVTSGKTRTALQLLTSNQQGGVHKLDTVIDGKSVRDILRAKHPDAKPAPNDILLEPPSDFDLLTPSIIFEGISTDDIRQAALNTQGSAGPSGLDASCWRRLCTAFGQYSNDLCASLAAFAKKIATSFVDPEQISAYTACRLIPLDKLPGVRPIGIAEVCRRIVGKVIMKYAKPDLQLAVGPLQLCAGLPSGCEASVHAMKTIFEEDDSEGMIFVDASNAFNRLNREATLLNSQTICPTLAPILINTYRMPPTLSVDGECIKSSEGTTQGDPLGLAMYAIGVQPLTKALKGIAKQAWYADDSAAGSSISNLKKWWDLISSLGPKYGYYPNSSKTKLLVKDQFTKLAKTTFDGTGIEVHNEGNEYLGGAIGSPKFIEQYLRRNVDMWTSELSALTKVAQTEPHAAYAAYTHGLMSRWNYILRVTDTEPHAVEDIFAPLEHQIRFEFIPTLTGQAPPNQSIRDLIGFPTALGGLNLPNPTTICSDHFNASKKMTTPLVEQITTQESRSNSRNQSEIRNEIKAEKHKEEREQLSALTKDFPPPLQKSIQLAQEKGASTWLSARPIHAHGFTLHKSEFRDALALRYGWPLSRIPSHCNCGKVMSVEHALTCSVGGYPTLRHNEVRDFTASLLSNVCHNVTVEPHLQPVEGEVFLHKTAITDDNARLDIAANGFWGHKFEKAFFDVRVFNPCAQSNSNAPIQSIYRRHEAEKRRAYEQRILEIEHASFTPIVLSATGGMAKSATVFYRRLAAMLSEKQGTPYSSTINWIRCKLSFALLRMAILSVRGGRSKPGRPANDPIQLQIVESGIN